MTRTYLDYNATAPLRPEAQEAMIAAMAKVGNASSVHAEGRAARALIELARETIAGLMGARPRDVVFTSGATEAANTVLTPRVGRPGSQAPLAKLLVSATEHVCVLNGHRFPAADVEILAVGRDGRVDVEALAARVEALTATHGPASVMVAVQAANNETGVVQPIGAIERRIGPHGAILVVDMVQLAGKTPAMPRLAEGAIGILSAHKLGGPQGVGAIVYGSDAVHPENLIRGGGQERSRRGGTENILGIVGFAAAAEAAFAAAEGFAARVGGLRDRLEADIRAASPEAVIFGEKVERLANTSCFAVPGIAAETLVIALDLEGIAISAGSACSSGKVAPSHVLAAMAVEPRLAKAAIRVSLGWDSTESDLHLFSTAWRRVLKHIALKGVQAA